MEKAFPFYCGLERVEQSKRFFRVLIFLLPLVPSLFFPFPSHFFVFRLRRQIKRANYTKRGLGGGR